MTTLEKIKAIEDEVRLSTEAEVLLTCYGACGLCLA